MLLISKLIFTSLVYVQWFFVSCLSACIFRFIWSSVPQYLIIVPVHTEQSTSYACICRTILCSAWLFIKHCQKQCQWGIYAGFNSCHWLWFWKCYLISWSGKPLRFDRIPDSVSSGKRAQMSRNLHICSLLISQMHALHYSCTIFLQLLQCFICPFWRKNKSGVVQIFAQPLEFSTLSPASS